MAQPSSSERKHVILWCLFLVALVGVVFHPVLRGEFLVWDDDFNISSNPHLTGLSLHDVKWAFTSTTYLWRYQPLCWLAWDTIKLFFGLNPFYYHLAVLLFHAANTVLVFLLIRELLLRSAQVARENAPRQFSICAAASAALWAVHPLRVETTAWAVELVFVQPLFFFLLSLLVYVRAAGTNRGRVISLGLFLVSLLSYPLALGGFVVFIALDFYPLRRVNFDATSLKDKRIRAVWLEKIPFVLASFAFAALNLHVRMQQSETLSHAATLAEFGAFSRLMQAFYVWAYYIWRPWLPFDITPIPTQLLAFRPLDAPFVFSALAVIGLSLLFWLKRQRWPWALAAWLCHLALLVPMLGLSEHPHFPSDRYSLIIGGIWSVLLAGRLLKIWPQTQLRGATLFAAAAVMILLSVVSYRQIAIWRTTVGFYSNLITRDDPKLVPFQTMLRHRLFQMYFDSHQYNEAIQVAKTAVVADPKNGDWHSQLGEAFQAAGQPKSAEASFREALQINPTDLWARNGLGIALAAEGKLDESKTQLTEALNQNAQKDLNLEGTLLQNLARVLKSQGKPDEAKVYLDRFQALRGSSSTK